VAPETAIVDENSIRKMSMRFNRRLPNNARQSEIKIVVGTEYNTNWTDRVRLFMNTGVSNRRWYIKVPTNLAGLPIGSVRYVLNSKERMRGMNTKEMKIIRDGVRYKIPKMKVLTARRCLPVKPNRLGISTPFSLCVLEGCFGSMLKMHTFGLEPIRNPGERPFIFRIDTY